MQKEPTRRESLLTYIYEGTQDAFNYRPDMQQYKEMSIEELAAEAERISNAVGETIDRESTEKTEAATRFEADITKIMAEHGVTREQAIEKDLERFNLTREDVEYYGIGYYCYHRNLDYHYFNDENIFGKSPNGPSC